MTAHTRHAPSRTPFGVTPDGVAVDAYRLVTPGGLAMQVITYGAIITSLLVPDREGCLDDVVFGHDSLAGYLDASPYFGAVIGRCANRIARGRFTLDGVEHQLATNDGPNHLHGGVRGFDRVVWRAEPRVDGSLVLSYESPDGEEGYPGRLVASVTYTLSDEEGLVVDYLATTDRATPVNLTQHSYWNLAGARDDQILRHELQVHADEFTPVDAGLIPTGERRAVAGTPFDFRSPVAIGARVDGDDEQLLRAGGYDHNYVLRAAESGGMRPAAILRDPLSGRVMTVRTTEPGLQVYSGNFLDGTIRGKGGRGYAHRGAVCLETQHFPDAVNRAEFPSVVLRPGREYRSRTEYHFGTSGGGGVAPA